MFIRKIEIGDENFHPGAPANERNVYNKLLHLKENQQKTKRYKNNACK